MPRAPKAPAAVQPAAAGPSGGGAALVNQGKAQQPPKKQQRKAAAGAAAATAAAVAAQQGGPFGAASGQLHTSGHAQSGSQQQAVSNAPADPAELERRIQHTRKQLADVEKQVGQGASAPRPRVVRATPPALTTAPARLLLRAAARRYTTWRRSTLRTPTHRATPSEVRNARAGGGGPWAGQRTG